MAHGIQTFLDLLQISLCPQADCSDTAAHAADRHHLICRGASLEEELRNIWLFLRVVEKNTEKNDGSS